MTKPKFSVLLPTRNRLDLAKSAIETVRRQTYREWELLVADNCSEEDVAGYLRSLSDDRVVHTRSETSVPVTDNWNRALARSSGDYVIMLGDDDGLLPGYFERLLEVIATLGDPDFIYHGAYHFAYPGVLPGMANSVLTDVTLYQGILRDRSGPALLAREEAHAVALAALDLRALYAFNMQHFLFSRPFLTHMSEFGPFFQGPFPDFYAANMAMLTAKRIGILPEPLVFIGISPKSYGFYHFNKREKSGISFLNPNPSLDDVPEALRQQLLPGTNMNTSWLLSVSLIPERLQGRTDLRPNIARYRRLQIIHNLRNMAGGQPYEATLRQLWSRLSWPERGFAVAVKAYFLPALLLRGRLRTKCIVFLDRWAGQYLRPPRVSPPPIVGRYETLLDVFDDLAAAAHG